MSPSPLLRELPPPLDPSQPHLTLVTTPPAADPAEECVVAAGAPPLTHRFIGKLAVFLFETVEGTRTIGQLGSWVSLPAAAQLAEHRALVVERRSLYKDVRRVVPTVQRVRVSQPSQYTAEAAIVLNTAGRSRAVAIRFEVVRRRWQATSVTVL